MNINYVCWSVQVSKDGGQNFYSSTRQIRNECGLSNRNLSKISSVPDS